MKDRISKLPLLSQDLLKLDKMPKPKKISGFLGSDWLLFWASISKTFPLFRGLYIYVCSLHELSNHFSFCLYLSLLSLSC